MRFRYRLLLVILFLLTLWTIPVQAVVPMADFNGIVAGERKTGFRDGHYSTALFNTPEGLVMDAEGRYLYVADSINHRVRAVDLDNDNEVSTLAGSDKVGSDDGTLDKATFSHPSRLAFVSVDKLAVYDSFGGNIRVIDLKAKTVSTLAGKLTARDMAYDPDLDSLVLTEPTLKKVIRVDVKTGTLTTLLDNDTQLTQPLAVCFHNGKIHLSDGVTSKIYSLDVTIDKKDQKKFSVLLSAVGKGDKVLGLASSDKLLYAVQAGNVPLVRIGQNTVPVGIPTHWGFLSDDSIIGFQPLAYFQPGDVIGFAASTTEARRFYLTRAFAQAGGVISLKDYFFAEYWKAAGPPGSTANGDGQAMDFDYPLEKPKNTFRILFSGDSRTNIAPALDPGSDYGNGWFYGGNRMDTMGKQLEFYLNSEAAVKGIKTRFEVLEWNRAGHSLSSYAYFEIPPLAKKYNVDMVLGLASASGYENYYEEPLSKEGIPQVEIDYEYILKPLSKRLQTPESKDLYERWKKGFPENTEKVAYPGQEKLNRFVCSSGDNIYQDIIQMTGYRLRMTADKVASFNGAKMVLFYVPGFDQEDDCMSPFWADISKKYDFPYIDLTDAFNSMRLAYHPVFTRCCSDHYTAYGDHLIGYLLSRYLIDGHLVPFEPEADKKKP